MLWTLIIAMLAAAALVLLLWLLRGVMLIPVRLRRGQELTLILRAGGDAAALENTMGGLIWLVENGTLPGMICIEDAGLSPEGRQAAAFLEKQYACVQFQASTGENTWENRST